MFQRKVICVLVIIFLSLSVLWAGDNASYVDLGFSPDGKIYMFAQYGVQSRTLRPWADLFLVDVSRNNFVDGGKLSYIHDKPVVSGQDGSGALYRLIAKNAPLAEKYKIDYCFQGQPLFIALDNNSPTGTIEFRDFQKDVSYKATLVSNVENSGANLKSCFYIDLERTGKNGSKNNYTVGNPQIKRPQVSFYCIRKVMIAPHDGSMIFLIEMKKQDETGIDIRYMVEALRL